MSRNSVPLDAFLGKHRPDIEVLDLAKCAGEEVERVFPQIEAKNQTLVVQLSTSSKVRASREELIRVIVELLKNAHKFTPSQGKIMVKSEKLDEYVKVSVIDTGIGITPEQQASIFGESNRISDGLVIRDSGLGLAIARMIIDYFGGEIGFENELSKGSTFWFTVPSA